MTQNLDKMLELFASNAQRVKREFLFQDTLVKRLAALLYAAEGKTADCMAIRECHGLIKQNTGVFSMFRGNLTICVAAMLSLAENRELQFRNTLEVYSMMKECRFGASDYLAVAAYQIAAHAPKAEHRRVVERSKAFYDGMKSHHWFLTGRDDYILSAMLGLSDIETKTGIERIERLFVRLRAEFRSGSAVQTLAQILVLCGDNDNIVDKVLALRDAFRRQNLRLDREYTLSSLGVLALLPVATAEIVRDVAESYAYLRRQSGFGFWSVPKQGLLLLSSALVAFLYVDDIKSGVLAANLSTNITSIIIAQQTAIAVAAAASASAAASSSSS